MGKLTSTAMMLGGLAAVKKIAESAERSSRTINSNNTYNTTINYNVAPPPAQLPVDNTPVHIDLKCPHCMGDRVVDEINMTLHCPYCDSRQLITNQELMSYRRLQGLAQQPVYQQQPSYLPVQPQQQFQQPYQTVMPAFQSHQPMYEPVRSDPQAPFIHQQSYPAVQPQTQQAVYELNSPAPYAPPKKRNTLLWVLGWLFIFPLPTSILISRNTDLNSSSKNLIIAIVWIMYLAMFVFH